MVSPPNAAFVSYASPDAEAALRLCPALRAAGSEVRFGRSERVAGTSGIKTSAAKSPRARSSCR